MARLKLKYVLLALLAVVSLSVAGYAMARPAAIQAGQPTFTPAPVAKTPSKDFWALGVVGDSFVTGSGMGGNDAANWTQLVGKSLTTNERTVELQKAGLAGSGYLHRGPTGKIFIEAIPGAITKDTSLIVFYGSINDIDEDPAAVGTAATAAYTKAHELAPNAKLLVFGPAWPNRERIKDITAIRDAVKTSAAKAGATFVDPLADGWFQGAASSLIGKDGTHPTDEGHAYMAQLATPKIQAALGI